jgi:glutathione synthase/RimK-type ligase-like ATP-grasp enzyme
VPACSLAAIRAEQFLFAPGVASFYADDTAIFFDCLHAALLFERAGLPVPPMLHAGTTDRDVLRACVARLGGFPLVLKVEGGSNGVGVVRVDSYAVLFALLDYFAGQGVEPLLSAFIAGAVHWRLVVVGDRVVAAYPNELPADDFRSAPVTNPGAYRASAPAALAAVAVRAVHVLRREFGGVDLLVRPDGAVHLLEANFPCYFPHAQLVAGLDVAGTMLDHLLGKAGRAEESRARKSKNPRARCYTRFRPRPLLR